MNLTGFMTDLPVQFLTVLCAGLISLIFLISGVISGSRRSRIGYRYVFACLPPFLWLLAPVFFAFLGRPSDPAWERVVHTLLFGFSTWFYWPLLLLFGVYGIYLVWGTKDNAFYEQAVAPRRSVWATFGVVVFVMTTLVIAFMRDTSRQVSGLEATAANLKNAIEETGDEAQQLKSATGTVAFCDNRLVRVGDWHPAVTESKAYSVSFASDCLWRVIDANGDVVENQTLREQARDVVSPTLTLSDYSNSLRPNVAELELQLSQLESLQEDLSVQRKDPTGDGSQDGQSRNKQVRDVLDQIDTLTSAIQGNVQAINGLITPPVETLEFVADEVDVLTEDLDDRHTNYLTSLGTLGDETDKVIQSVGDDGKSNVASLQSLNDEVNALIEARGEQDTTYANSLQSMADQLDELIVAAGKVTPVNKDSLNPLIERANELVGSAADNASVDVDDLETLAGALNESIAAAGDEATVAISSLEPVTKTLNGLLEAAQAPSPDIARLQLVSSRLEGLNGRLQSDEGTVVSLVQERADAINDLAYDLQPTTAVLLSNCSIPFLIVTTLFVVFLLLPWLLYLSFITGKRANIIRDRRKMIEQLGLKKQFLNAPVTGLGDDQQEVARKVAHYLLSASKQLGTDPKDPPTTERIKLAQHSVTEAVTQLEKNHEAAWKQSPELARIRNSLKNEVLPLLEGKARASSQPSPPKEGGIVARIVRFFKAPAPSQPPSGKEGEDSATAEPSPRDVARVRAMAQMAQMPFGLPVPRAAPDLAAKPPPAQQIQDARLAAELLRILSDEASEVVIKQRNFYSREYILPLLILTALTMVGWFYVIFPDTLVGLVNLIQEGASLKDMTKQLTGSFTTVTMTFAGAWLYITVRLISRWTQDDLYPRSYMYSALRLAIALLVGLVFANWFTPVESSLGRTYIFMLAFAVGAAPIEFVRAIWRALGQTGSDIADTLRNSEPVNWVLGEVVREFKPPDWGSKRPLTALEDVNIWDEGRLYLEGVQNVHALATADLVRVVLNTPFDAQQLVDWVDQALLYIHAKDLWRSGLAAVGIRTATDLFDYCLKPKKEGGDWRVEELSPEPDEDKLRKLAGAFNAAQLMVLGTGDPRYEAFNAGSALETAAEDLEKQYTAVKELSDSLDKEKEASLDNIVALRENVNAITEEKVNAAQDARAPVHAALTAAGETGDDDELLKAWEDGGTIDEKLTALAEPRQKASEAIEEKDNNEYKLTREKLGSSDETEKKAAQGVLEEAKKQVAALSSAVTEAKEAIQTAKENIAKKYKDDQANTFAEKANALQSAVDELVTKVTEANDLAGTLTKDNAKEKATGKEVTNAEDLQNKLAAAQEARKTAEEAAGTLETAVDGVESLKATVKPKVTALKGQLGTLKDTIEAAVTEVQKVQDASAPTDNDIKSAKEKVTAVFDAVDPEKDGSAKKAMKEITDFYNPTDATNLKNSAEKANALESAVDELVTKVTEAKDLAVKLTKENAGEKPEGKEVTNVEDLKSKLDAAETARETAKGAADTLETAVESLGSLKATVKPKVTALKEQLGEQQDKLKARIEGAVNQVQQVVQKVKAGQLLNDTDISGVKDKVTAVYNAVVPEQDGSAEKAMKEIADFFAAYNMYKSGAPMAKAKEAVAAIEALETLGTAANNVAKDLKADDKKTWDNVLGLQGKLEELQKQVETVEEKRKDVSKKLEALKDQETYAVAQARRAIDAVSVTDATDKVKAAKTELEGQSADKTDKLEDGKKKVTEAVTALEKLKKETDSAAKEAISASLPLQLTEDILAIMLAAMKRDPNIVHVCRFWDERMTEAKAAT